MSARKDPKEHFLLAGCAALALAACGGVGRGGGSQAVVNPNSTALFEPVASGGNSALIPFPFDGLFSGYTAPTLNIPGLAAPLSDANLQDGFSTTASIYSDLSGQLDYSTVPGHLLIFNSATGTQLQPGVDFSVGNEDATAANGSGQQTPISAQRSRLLITPLKPLAPSTRYLVALTNGMKTLQGNAVQPSVEFSITASATPVAQQTGSALAQFSTAQQAQLEILRSQYIAPAVQAVSQLAAVPAAQIVLAWSFTTESIGDSLNLIAAKATPGSISVANTGLTTSSTNGKGYADIYAGITTLPYYLQVPSSAAPAAPLSDYWQADASQPSSGSFGGSFLGQVPCSQFAAGATVDGVTLKPSASTTACFPAPLAQSNQTVPVLVTVPDAKATGLSKPAAGWPVVIFQHGLGASREDLFYIADRLAQAGFVAVAIDLPLHGVTDTSDPYYQNRLLAGTAPSLETGERTFNLDLENNSTGAAGADGQIDASGTWFLNWKSLITTRDNLREAAADLVTLAKTVSTLDLDGDGKPDTDAASIGYFGHSMGGVVGGTLLGVDQDVGAAVLANAGGGIVKLLEASQDFGPDIALVLRGLGAAQGSDDYEIFLRYAQILLDDGDPINYAAAARPGHAIDMIEVIGDTVVPNAAPSTCPAALPGGIDSAAALVAACPATATQAVTIEPGGLSGTAPLVEALGLDRIGPVDVPVAKSDVVTGSSLGYVVQFAQGSHVTALNPAANPQETAEMQSEAAGFLASGGQCLPVGGDCP
jgi:dienelactone hydrolase